MTTLIDPFEVLIKKSRTTKKNKIEHLPSMDRVATIILGGGEGKRLYPLTSSICKPAVKFGGRYRLIDVPISNAINSGCRQIFVITQYLSALLHQHIIKTYYRGLDINGVTILSPEQKPGKKSWFEGTADAVRQNMEYFPNDHVDYYLILSGDQLYNLDYRNMLKVAKETGADLVLAALPIKENDCHRMGVLQVDKNSIITEFVEKPNEQHQIDKLVLPAALKSKVLGKTDHNHLASMGIYLFRKDVLIDLLFNDTREDFGKHLLPSIIEKGNSAAYLFKGYWEDIGTISSFYSANIQMTLDKPDFHCLDETWPIFSAHNHLPPAKISSSQIYNSIICEGSILDASEVSNSIIGPRSIIHKGTTIQSSYLIGYNSRPQNKGSLLIGRNCRIHKTIIDKDVSIGNNVQLINHNQLENYDGENIYIRDGIIVVPRGASIPDGFIL